MWLFYYFYLKGIICFKSKSPCFLFQTKIWTLIKTKWNLKWKIPYAILERWALCFSSHRDQELKVKLWWVGALSWKNSTFFERLFCLKKVLCFIAMYIVFNRFSKCIYFNILKNTFNFIHFSCFFLKSLKTFSVSLNYDSFSSFIRFI